MAFNCFLDEPYSPEDSDPDNSPPRLLPLPTTESPKLSETVVTTTAKTFVEPNIDMQAFNPFSGKFDSIPGILFTPFPVIYILIRHFVILKLF